MHYLPKTMEMCQGLKTTDMEYKNSAKYRKLFVLKLIKLIITILSLQYPLIQSE